jgi:hypothetical protein
MREPVAGPEPIQPNLRPIVPAGCSIDTGTYIEHRDDIAQDATGAPMARYRFHCTNGLECVFDARGADIRAAGRLPLRARRVAVDVMRSLSDRTDWSEWQVSVHDLSGRRVMVQPFRQLVGDRPLAA